MSSQCCHIGIGIVPVHDNMTITSSHDITTIDVEGCLAEISLDEMESYQSQHKPSESPPLPHESPILSGAREWCRRTFSPTRRDEGSLPPPGGTTPGDGGSRHYSSHNWTIAHSPLRVECHASVLPLTDTILSSSPKRSSDPADSTTSSASNTTTEQKAGYYPRLRAIATKVPFFTILILALLWTFFLWGASVSHATIDWSSPISPADSSFWFRGAVTSYPDCASLRSEGWRLTSYQFVHEGLLHIGSNSLLLVVYGLVSEFAHPFGFIISVIAYECGVVVGALTYYYVFPYVGLIGASAGLYTLIGLMVAHLIVNAEYFSRAGYRSLVALLAVQYTGDICYYFVFYSPSVGYAAHCGGMFFGFNFGLALAVRKPPVWKKVAGVLGIILLSLHLGLIIHNYAGVWPPRLLTYNPTFHSYNPSACCSELFQRYSSAALDEVRNSYICQGTQLHPY